MQKSRKITMKRRRQERRQFPRMAWDGTATYHWSTPALRPKRLRVFSGRGEIRNLSPQGLCLFSDQRLPPKQMLTITVPMREEGPAIPMLAYVHWSKPMRGTGRYAMGLSFLAA